MSVVDPDSVVDRAGLAAALTRRRASADRSVRDVARATGLSVSTVGGWFSGRNLPQRSQRTAFLAVLRACEVDPADHDAWVAALERVRATPVPAVAPPPTRPDTSPYRGLQSFETTDADWFFGRDRVTDQLRTRVAAAAARPGPRVLAVVGASGSGKSSVLRAGLVPAVARDGLPGDHRRWVTEVMTPGQDPRATLASRPSAVGDGHDGDDHTVGTLLVVDQFEELFAASVDDAARTGFLDELFAAAGGETVVVLGLRADFYAAAVADPRLARVLQDGQVVIAPMDEDDLRAAIVEPAARAGREVDADLVERLLRETGVDRAGGTHDTGALPLLSHALRATWEHATGPRLTRTDYEATGGVAGSIEQTAEQVFTDLDGSGQSLARQVFLRLVRVDDATGVVTRRPLDRDDLPGDDPAVTAAVLGAFVDRRLLTADTETVGISHERLLTAWPRLAEWIDADRDALRFRHHLTDAVRAWQTNGRDPSYLLSGTRLAAAAELAAGDDASLSPAEHDLVTASVAAVESDRRRQRRRLRRTRQLLGLVAVLLVVAAGTGVLAVRASRESEDSRRRAVAAGREALSPLVAVNARQVLPRDPALAQQLALVAWRTAPSTQARSALLDLTASGVVTRLVGGSGPTAAAVSRDGRLLAVSDGSDGAVRLYDLRDGRPSGLRATLPGAAGRQVFALTWNGSVLVVGSTDGSVALWDTGPTQPHRRADLAAFPATVGGAASAVEGVAVSPDGRLLAAVSDGTQPVRVWDLSAGSPRLVGAPSGVTAGATEQAVTFSPDGTRLLSAGTGGVIWSWPTADLVGTPAAATPSPTTQIVDTLRYDPSGRSLWSGNRGGSIVVRDAASLAVTTTHQLTDSGWVSTLAFSPDGREVAVGTSEGAVERFSAADWTVQTRSGNQGPVTGLAYTPDGRALVTAAADGTVRVLRADAPVTVGDGLAVFSLSFDRSGRSLAVATSGAGATARLWDTADAASTRTGSPALTVPDLTGTGALRPDGALLATGSRDGSVRLWDTRDPSSPIPVGGPFAGATALVETLAFSPDGRLLAVGSDDHTLRLWDVSTPATPEALGVMTTGNYVVGAAWSPDGTQIAGAGVDELAHVWDVRDPARPRQRAELGGFANYVWGVAYSPDGRLLAATSADRTTRIWDVAGTGSPRLLSTLSGPRGYDLAVAFSPDGHQLAVASHDQNVWLYDVSTPTRPVTLATLDDVGGNVNVVTFAPDGRLVAGGYSTDVPIWDTDPDRVAASICATAGDRITRTEWAQYVPGAAYAPPCG